MTALPINSKKHNNVLKSIELLNIIKQKKETLDCLPNNNIEINYDQKILDNNELIKNTTKFLSKINIDE